MSNDAHSTSTTSTTAHEIAHNWLEKFSAAFDVASGDDAAEALGSLFLDDCYWRDLTAFPGTSPPQRDCLQFAT